MTALILSAVDRVQYTSLDLKDVVLFCFILLVLGLLGWIAYTKAPSPLNWIIVFVLAAAAVIVGYRFLQAL